MSQVIAAVGTTEADWAQAEREAAILRKNALKLSKQVHNIEFGQLAAIAMGHLLGLKVVPVVERLADDGYDLELGEAGVEVKASAKHPTYLGVKKTIKIHPQRLYLLCRYFPPKAGKPRVIGLLGWCWGAKFRECSEGVWMDGGPVNRQLRLDDQLEHDYPALQAVVDERKAAVAA